MAYFLTAMVLVGAAALHWWWRRRYQVLHEQFLRERDSLFTARKQYGQEAAQKQAEQQALFNSMAEGVLVLDQSGRVQLVNRSLQKLFGLTTDVRGQTIMEAFRLRELVEVVQRLQGEQTVTNHEFQLPGVTEQRWLEVNAAAVLDSQNMLRGSILVFHDLTRLKQLENTRQEFVANVSHELRTPLSLIKGYVETLLDGARNNPEVVERFLKIIERNTQRLDLLIQDLLTISALESGRIQLNLQPVELRPLVEKVFTDLKARAEEKDVKLVNQLNDLTALADAHRMEQVFANLVDNAIKYGRTQGMVTVGGRKTDAGRIEVFVQDDGPGIPPEALDRVFERFYRVDKARSREQGGTGLGLSIVKHIVQNHDGEVWAKSEPGKGTAFFFTLPGEKS